MKWDEGHQSPDVIDRRGQGGGGMGGMGLLGLLPLVTRFRGGWVIALLIVGFMLFGGLGGLGGMFGDSGETTTTSAPLAGHKTDDKKAQFVAFVLDDTQATWRQELAKIGKTYRNAKLVMFTGATETACGNGQAATGPFYCPTDERVYIDLSFYDELEKRFGAKGDFAQAYVIAHEIGHHVQNQLGISSKVHNARAAQQRGEEGLSVRLELQADCFAGIWAHDSEQKQLLDPGDIDEALTAAAAIGDDRLQRQSGGRVNPESWTHGSSAQRSRWFKTGYERGSVDACDTFAAAAP
ncbi:MAG: YpfJ protein zinc metalloprotease superfamily [Labilithrix sp.]|nr:YpfJ protein zinc metalloprotease superfamily [Labilithrix sp.]